MAATLDDDGDAVHNLAHDHQVLALTSGKHVVRLLPPLVVNTSHVDRVVDALAAVVP